MTYRSLEQRMISAYTAIFPDFVPKENAVVSKDEQHEFYDMMKKLYQLLFENTSLIIPTLHEDDAFPSRYKKGYGKPELEINVLKIKAAVEKLLQNMFLIGQGADVKFNKRQLNILSLIGIHDFSKLPSVWIWMSTRPKANKTSFAYCLFDEEHVYSIKTYARLLNEEPFMKLEKWMVSQGYKPYDIYNITASDCKLSLVYANAAWGDNRPTGGNEYKIKNTGISVQYDAYVENPTSLGVCIPYGLKRHLENFELMNATVKEFIIERTKKCDGCRYCVQTDKSGSRPLALVPISYKDIEYKLCPYFPGYNYSWTSMDENLSNKIIELLRFMDGFSNDMP